MLEVLVVYDEFLIDHVSAISTALLNALTPEISDERPELLSV